MASTDWTKELKLGGGVEYDNDSQYDAATITRNGETFTNYYDTTGLATTWSNESQ